MRDICVTDACTGCNACLNACSKNAIIITKDELGFSYPKIDESLCVNCGMCKYICPSINLPKLNLVLESKIAYANDSDEQISSTSGGIASVICRAVISQGGVAYGCTSYEYPSICHKRIVNESDLYLIKGSKYVQSDIGLIYKQVRDDLHEKKVVFVGTPCQCAGLKNFLKREYKNLILLDFVCHGVPSQKLLTDSIKCLHLQATPSHISFRIKENRRESQYGLFLYDDKNNSIYKGYFPKNDYICGFMSALFYRKSCYQCLYTQTKRCSDITLGDYWDTNNNCDLGEKKNNGLSMLMINTEKGKKMIELCSHSISSLKSSIEHFSMRNRQLCTPMPKHKYYNSFASLYSEYGYKKASRKFLPVIKCHYIVNILYSKLKALVDRF